MLLCRIGRIGRTSEQVPLTPWGQFQWSGFGCVNREFVANLVRYDAQGTEIAWESASKDGPVLLISNCESPRRAYALVRRAVLAQPRGVRKGWPRRQLSPSDI